MTWSKHVLAHGPLQQLAPRLWQVEGSLPRGRMPRNMTIYRLTDGGLVIHSAIALNEACMRALTDLGEPRYMIVPNRMHRLDAGVWQARFPSMQVLAPAAAMQAVQAKARVDASCEDVLPDLGILTHAPAGIRPSELAYEVDSDGQGSKALIVTDLLMNLPRLPGIDGWLMGVLGSTGFFGITRIGRLFLLQDRLAFQAWLTAMAALPKLQVICVGHGKPITIEPAAALRSAAARLG